MKQKRDVSIQQSVQGFFFIQAVKLWCSSHMYNIFVQILLNNFKIIRSQNIAVNVYIRIQRDIIPSTGFERRRSSNSEKPRNKVKESVCSRVVYTEKEKPRKKI